MEKLLSARFSKKWKGPNLVLLPRSAAFPNFPGNVCSEKFPEKFVDFV